ncbi:MAG: hypothetical protein ABI972_24070 [Acidobacteriota bacterium]
MKIMLALGVLLTAAAWFAGAQQQQQQHNDNFSYPRRLQVPKSYGKFVAVYADQLLFEDDGGTIRSVYPNGGKVIFEIRR